MDVLNSLQLSYQLHLFSFQVSPLILFSSLFILVQYFSWKVRQRPTTITLEHKYVMKTDNLNLKHVAVAAWKMSVFRVFLVGIFPHSDRKNSEHGHFSRSVLFFKLSLYFSSNFHQFLLSRKINPLVPGFHSKVTHTNLKLSGLIKEVWPLSGHRALKG